jgi:hypothetical protein
MLTMVSTQYGEQSFPDRVYSSPTDETFVL